MSRKKQIEELKEILLKECGATPNGKCINKSCSECRAETVIGAGYSKQSEGEWVVTDSDSGSFGEYAPFIEFKCPKCESVYGIESGQYGWEYGEPIPWVSCPLCGAKMKGE
jgi:ribosomal protein S27E